MDAETGENFYYSELRKIISHTWSSDGRYGIRIHYDELTGNLYVKLCCDSFISCKIEGNDVKYETEQIGYECLIAAIKEYPTDNLPCYYQISGYGPIRSITECFTNIKIIKHMFLTIQNIQSMFTLESQKSSIIHQIELDNFLTNVLRYTENNVLNEIIKIEKKYEK